MGKKKGSSGKKNTDTLIMGIAIGYAAAYLMNNSHQMPPIKVPQPHLPSQTTNTGGMRRRLPSINRRPWSMQNPLFYMAY